MAGTKKSADKGAAARAAGTKSIATNRRARFDYEILDTWETGIALLGSEVKSLRLGRADLKDSYAYVKRGEMWLVGVRISPYEYARDGGHDPERERKLLLHKREIEKIGSQIAEKGLTVLPVRLYFKEGKVKVELGLARGKAQRDKRETLKRRQADRDMQRAIRHKDID
jgi:SsrA-binding protein